MKNERSIAGGGMFPPRTCIPLTDGPPAECRDMRIAHPCDRRFDDDAFDMRDGSFYATLLSMNHMDPSERLECLSRRFLGLPYLTDPLGEGLGADIDEDPLFRFDALDCMTFVEEVLALFQSDTFEHFLKRLTDIRYHSGIALYGLRNHFVSADWLPHNAALGWLRDDTAAIADGQQRSMSILIDRAGWILDKAHLDNAQKIAVLETQISADLEQPEIVQLEYLPLDAFLLNKESSAAMPLQKLPEASIALFLRQPEAAGTMGVMVAHMGLLFARRNEDGTASAPILRHSSSREGLILDEPLVPYLERIADSRAGVVILTPPEEMPE